jgi:hypothetical protein
MYVDLTHLQLVQGLNFVQSGTFSALRKGGGGPHNQICCLYALICVGAIAVFFVVDSAWEIAGATGEYVGSLTGQGKWLSIAKLVGVAAKAALSKCSRNAAPDA